MTAVNNRTFVSEVVNFKIQKYCNLTGLKKKQQTNKQTEKKRVEVCLGDVHHQDLHGTVTVKSESNN